MPVFRSQAALEAYILASRTRSGVPDKITDPEILARFAGKYLEVIHGTNKQHGAVSQRR